MTKNRNSTEQYSSVTTQEASTECEQVPAQREPSRCSGGSFSGAPPSNTAPANYIPENENVFHLLRYGVDSLYLSYPGKLSHDWDQRLKGLKLAAKASDNKEESTAQVRIAAHLFEVKDRGQGRFPFVLEDNWFRIALSSSSATSMPLAYVKISSELLTAIGVEKAEMNLRFVINTLGLVTEEANISRVDLFVDFTTNRDIDNWDVESWVTRAHNITAYHIQGQFSGWSIGLGKGPMGGRLYDKTLEILKSHKHYLKPLWRDAGWEEDQKVWRLEFEFKRQALLELGVEKVGQLLPSQDGLWRYASQTWLRLTVPNPHDDNQSRWPTHPLWESLSTLKWGDKEHAPLTRTRKERVPSDESLFINGLGGITSFMAKNGITDLGEGFGEFLAYAQKYHDDGGGKSEISTFARYIADKVSQKGRRFNTLQNKPTDGLTEKAKAARAEAYRKGRDGE